MDKEQPVVEKWNFDSENREPLPKKKKNIYPQIPRFLPDPITQTVFNLVEKNFRIIQVH